MTVPASGVELPAYLTIGRYAHGSKALNDLRAAKLSDPQSQPPAQQQDRTASLGFDDLLDLINPLQHLPVVSTAYRALTGDTISPVARLAGGALFGGPIGFAISAVDTLVEQISGSDRGAHVLALFDGEPDGTRAIAAAEPQPQPTAPEPVASHASAPQPAEETLAAKSPPSIPASVPTLSPEAFNALLASVENPEPLKAQENALVQPETDPASQTSADKPLKTATADPLRELEQALRKLDRQRASGTQTDLPLAAF